MDIVETFKTSEQQDLDTFGSDELRIQLLQEELQVGKQLVDTGRGVRVFKKVVETPHLVEQPLAQDHLIVTHVPFDQFIEPNAIPETRYEGSTMIIPIVEEVMVWEKRLKLKEEIHITRETRTVLSAETVYLRSDQIQIDRFDESSSQ